MLLTTYDESFFGHAPFIESNLLVLNGFHTNDKSSFEERAFFQSKFPLKNVVLLDWENTVLPFIISDYICARMQANSQASRIGHWIMLNEDVLNGSDIIVHSMGSKVITDALLSLDSRCKIKFKNIFFIAGDVRSDVFEEYPHLKDHFENIHVFYNRSDAALIGSTVLNLHARLGEHACSQATTNRDCHSFAHLFDKTGHSYYHDDEGDNESPVIATIRAGLC
jgi:hypothetical protein